ncbi:MAG: hypothetical protein K8F52_14695 [Candidatus Scalindua rubra]|uniref:Lipoprotein n=1 Tax=Candidatus Scalindua brodae TaxID=237368 RepID=A0A0B0EFT3_9BACT|nr:MAG: hypothetical protein SCABRO_02806 [Candidatus Scalindua brodae]MBZ0109899.1 hypothetical protein [Candidatus Scalindua rubra]
MAKKYYVYLLISVLMFAGCKTTNISQIPYRKEYSKSVNELVILHYPESPQMDVNIRNDEMFISSLVCGPAIIPQLMMLLAKNHANEEDTTAFNEIIFDLDIGDILCEKLNTKFQLCSYFHVVPQESILNNKTLWQLMEKKDKEVKDYVQVGTEFGIDTILETDVLSFGIKDPGIFSDPYAFIKVDVKMTTAQGTVIWRDIVQARTEIGMKTVELVDMVYADVEFLKKKLEEVVDAVSELCIEKLGFDTNYTYLLEEDYIKKTKHKINIAEKLNELNVLRYEDIISDTDYDKTKLDLIEKARGRSDAVPGTETQMIVTAIANPEVK